MKDKLYKWFPRIASLAVVGYMIASFVFMPIVAYGSSSVTALVTNGLTSILTSPSHVSAIVFANATGTAGTVSLYDTGTTNLTWSRDGYTNTIYYTTNSATTYTNFAGVIETNTYVRLVSQTVEVAAATNSFRVIGTYTVPAGESLSVTLPTDGTYVTYGITATNDNAMSATLTYSSLK